jgi:hypothetical protein
MSKPRETEIEITSQMVDAAAAVLADSPWFTGLEAVATEAGA